MISASSYYNKMSTNYNDIPCGIRIIEKISEKCCHRIRFRRHILYKMSVLFLTYIAYMCYHMTRKPISVVKSVLHRNCSTLDPPSPVTVNDTTWCDYPPFDQPNAIALFGTLDSAFLFCYAIAMFGSGFIAERCSLRYFLSSGMILTGLFTYLFGIAKTANIHSLWYFIIVQALAGIFQTTGWPGVVTVVGRWFGKSKRGLIFGIWNSHTSIGNILGTVIAGYYVETDWGMSFITPGIIIAIAGFLLFLFLVDSPDLVGCQIQESSSERRLSNSSDIENNDPAAIESGENNLLPNNGINSEISYRPNERTPMLRTPSISHLENRKPIGLVDALLIPGVIEFSLCLFFSKLVSYTFLYWLPLYIQATSKLDPSTCADLSTVFDIGGMVGAIAAGLISDSTSMSATTCAIMLILAAPVLVLYHLYQAASFSLGLLFLFLAGVLVNGPYALITTSVSAELGQHSSLEGNSKALATVTAIIDGTGSIGAAVGPLLTGLISRHGWEKVFHMLIASDLIAMLLLLRLVIKELSKFKRNARIE